MVLSWFDWVELAKKWIFIGWLVVLVMFGWFGVLKFLIRWWIVLRLHWVEMTWIRISLIGDCMRFLTTNSSDVRLS